MKEDFEKAIAKLESKNPETRKQAIRVIGKNKGKKANKYLIKALDDEVERNRVEAALCLAARENVGAPKSLEKSLKDSNNTIRISIAEVFVKAGDRGVQVLSEFLLSCNAEERKNVLFATGKDKSFEAKIIEIMKQELRGKDAGRKTHAALVLGELGYQLKPVIRALEKGLSSEDEMVRTDSFKLLAKWRLIDEGTLISSVKDGTPEIKISAMIALEKNKNAIPAILSALEDEDEDVRVVAAETLGNMRAKKAVEPLVKMLKEDTADCREAAAVALGEIRDERAIAPLLEALRDEELDVMVQVYGPLYDPSNSAALALEQFGKKAVEPLIQALNRGGYDHDTKLFIATTLGHIGDKRAIKPLRKLMKTLDNDAAEVVQEAIDEISMNE